MVASISVKSNFAEVVGRMAKSYPQAAERAAQRARRRAEVGGGPHTSAGQLRITADMAEEDPRPALDRRHSSDDR